MNHKDQIDQENDWLQGLYNIDELSRDKSHMNKIRIQRVENDSKDSYSGNKNFI